MVAVLWSHCHSPSSSFLMQIESNDRPDAEVANESWMTYKKRNNSFFVDLFGGQFKSTLVCPACSKASTHGHVIGRYALPLPLHRYQ